MTFQFHDYLMVNFVMFSVLSHIFVELFGHVLCLIFFHFISANFYTQVHMKDLEQCLKWEALNRHRWLFLSIFRNIFKYYIWVILISSIILWCLSHLPISVDFTLRSSSDFHCDGTIMGTTERCKISRTKYKGEYKSGMAHFGFFIFLNRGSVSFAHIFLYVPLNKK